MDGLQKESTATTRKRSNSYDNNERNSKRQKMEVLQPVDAMETDCQLAASAITDPKINDIPIEIIGNNIFNYFDFKYWLKNLIPVCKYWQQAAIRSSVDKQIWLPRLNTNKKFNILGIHTILSKYKISTLIICNTNSSIYYLFGLINASSALSTLVLDNTSYDLEQYTKNHARKFEKINTLVISVTEYQMLRFFPNVKRLTLIGDLQKENRWKTKEFTSNKVKELEITTNYATKEKACLTWAKKIFPSLATIYVNQRKDFNSIEDAEKNWKKLEEHGKRLGVTVHCRYLHHQRQFFDLQGISYAHYVNSYSRTPLETLYSYNNIKTQREFLEKHHVYLTVEYEQSFSQRARQFVFPILSCGMNWSASKYQIDDQMAQLLQEFGLLPDTVQKKRKFDDQILSKDDSEFQSIKELLIQMSAKELDQLTNWHMQKIVGTNSSFEDLIDIFGEERLLKYTDDDFNLASIALHNENYNVWLGLVQLGVEIKLGLAFRLLIQFFMEAYESIKDVIPKDFSTKFLFHYLPKMTARHLQVFIGKTKIQLDDIFNEKGQSVLTYLIEHKEDCTSILEIVLDKFQLDINKPDQNSSTPLISAIMQQSISFVDILLERGANPNTAGDTVLPLSYCLSMSNREFVSQALFSLLLHGADVNKSDFDAKGRLICPLKTAVGCGAPVEMIEVLVSHGARLDFVDNAGNTLLHSVFPNRGDVKTAGIELENTIDLIKYLSKYVDINTRNKVGQTPLHFASLHSDEELEVKTLIECGADVNATEDMMRMTPLLMMLDESLSAFVNKLTALLSNGKVNIQHKNKVNQSFVHYLLQFSPSVIADIFSDTGNVNDPVHDLIKVCKQYATPENMSFIKNEIDSYLKNNSDKDLHRELSLFTLDISLTKLLIKALGFDVNFNDKHDNSLLLISQTSFYSNDQVVEYLSSKGAKPTSSDIAKSKLEVSLSLPTKYRMTCQVVKERQAYLKLGADEGSGTIAPLMALKRNEFPPDFIDDVITNMPHVDLIQRRKNDK